MHELIKQHQAEIAELCRRYGVQKLDVFGSAARGQDFDLRRSDVDFLVEFRTGPTVGYAHTYFALQEALERLVGRPVELVTASSIRNPYFRAAIQKSREPIYGS